MTAPWFLDDAPALTCLDKAFCLSCPDFGTAGTLRAGRRRPGTRLKISEGAVIQMITKGAIVRQSIPTGGLTTQTPEQRNTQNSEDGTQAKTIWIKNSETH